MFHDLEMFIIQKLPISTFFCESFVLLRQKIEFVVRKPGYKKGFFTTTHTVSMHYTSRLCHMGFFEFLFAQNLCMQTATAHLKHTILRMLFPEKNCILQVLQNYQISFHCTSKWVKTCFPKCGLNLHCSVLV